MSRPADRFPPWLTPEQVASYQLFLATREDVSRLEAFRLLGELVALEANMQGRSLGLAPPLAALIEELHQLAGRASQLRRYELGYATPPPVENTPQP
jgi:hypothetical protein